MSWLIPNQENHQRLHLKRGAGHEEKGTTIAEENCLDNIVMFSAKNQQIGNPTACGMYAQGSSNIHSQDLDVLPQSVGSFQDSISLSKNLSSNQMETLLLCTTSGGNDRTTHKMLSAGDARMNSSHRMSGEPDNAYSHNMQVRTQTSFATTLSIPLHTTKTECAPVVATQSWIPKKKAGHFKEDLSSEEMKKSSNSSVVDDNTLWVCDVCNQVAFESYQEACKHEKNCSKLLISNDANVVNTLSGKKHQIELGEIDVETSRMETSIKTRVTKRVCLVSRSIDDKVKLPPISFKLSEEINQSKNGELDRHFFPFLPNDKKWLSDREIFLRKNCIEITVASAEDAAVNKTGRHKSIRIGQVGFRCTFCANSTSRLSPRAVSYPNAISCIYKAFENFRELHLPACNKIPQDARDKYATLKNNAKHGAARYRIEAAKELGMEDHEDGGIFFGRNSLLDVKVSKVDEEDISVSGETSLVKLMDKPLVSEFRYMLFSQLEPCVFEESDRCATRRDHSIGFPGLHCRYCKKQGCNDGRYFPSTLKILSAAGYEKVFHDHLMKCRYIPKHISDYMSPKHCSDQSPTRRLGSRKTFYYRIWNRLHS